MIGREIFNFKIQSLLGSGGMADVYLAKNKHTGREVAIKHLLPNLQSKPAIVERFKKELKIMASIQHENAVEVKNYDDTDGLFILLEYVDGKDLSHKIASLGGPMPIVQALNIMIQVLDAFTVIHKKGIVHRDIKPSNILLTKNGKVKVTDFGISGIVGEGELEKTNVQSMGTVPYMSPEQIQNRKIDQRSDIYSLGVTLYEMLIGSSIYSGCTSPYEIQSKIVKEDLPSLVDTLGSEYTAIWKVIQRATQKDQNARYANVISMKGALLEGTIIDDTATPKPGPKVETPPKSPKDITGCMDPKALNYNPKANVEGTCQYAEPPKPPVSHWTRLILIAGCVILIGVIGFFMFRPGDTPLFKKETLTEYVKAGEYQEALDYLDGYPVEKEKRQEDITAIEELLQISKL